MELTSLCSIYSIKHSTVFVTVYHNNLNLMSRDDLDLSIYFLTDKNLDILLSTVQQVKFYFLSTGI